MLYETYLAGSLARGVHLRPGHWGSNPEPSGWESSPLARRAEKVVGVLGLGSYFWTGLSRPGLSQTWFSQDYGISRK